MKHLLIIVVAVLLTVFLCHPAVSADQQGQNVPSEIKQYLEQRGLQITATVADVKKTGYILVLGTANGDKVAAKRAATVTAQRAIVSLLAELPSSKGKAGKQVVRTPPVTKTRVSGTVRRATPLFSHYDSSDKTMYLLLQKPVAVP
ncbi:hypothetical protein [Trichlorobacter lovleyi]|uniref:SPOR domain-containing protein n=1 Tax=Trichlorobacter lovleyi (strain ATCC BAA-1151 / DSM 17278 / SZ) TaxID=398767 RepID=B3E2Q7_TRIL1|nr:hypothetical protein [Trichlorobacter lovleyi]ACD95714.1 hypothetical protein Glov_1998 [Trichlorobacter lovleyi SZ]